MNRDELIKKIIEKKDFSQLPEKDIGLALDRFDKPHYLDEEKVKLTRDLLRKTFSVFTSNKLLNIKDKDSEWILNKHISTRERLKHYPEVYKKIFSYIKLENQSNLFVFDLGAGINGFSYRYFPTKLSYIGIEGMNQLVSLTNYYFNKKGLNGEAIHDSLFNLDKIKKIIFEKKGKKILFLFKVIDSLEMLQENYSKLLLRELTPLVDFVVVSFATRSLVSKKKFKVNRNWIFNFIRENFELIEDFETGNEKYIIFQLKDKPKFK